MPLEIKTVSFHGNKPAKEDILSVYRAKVADQVEKAVMLKAGKIADGRIWFKEGIDGWYIRFAYKGINLLSDKNNDSMAFAGKTLDDVIAVLQEFSKTYINESEIIRRLKIADEKPFGAGAKA